MIEVNQQAATDKNVLNTKKYGEVLETNPLISLLIHFILHHTNPSIKIEQSYILNGKTFGMHIGM